MNNNASYKAAFIASAAGIKVQRLTEDVVIDNNRIKKGSFLLSANGNGSKALDEILKTGNYFPLMVKDAGQMKLSGFSLPRIGLTESWDLRGTHHPLGALITHQSSLNTHHT